MNQNMTAQERPIQRRHFDRQVMLLILTAIIAFLFLVFGVTEGHGQTLFLFLAVAMGGLILIMRLS